jgi:5-methylcytosine-specific restriction protein A
VATFLLTWNPDGDGWPDENYRAQVERLAAGKGHGERWSLGIRKSGVSPGDRCFLMRQRHERGLVASGVFTSGITVEEHWDGSRRDTTYARIRWTDLLPVEDGLPVHVLKAEVPEVTWDRLQGSGVQVAEPVAQRLEEVWAEHVNGTPYREPGDLPPRIYEEGSVTRIEVNRYERDRAARAACIAAHGLTCDVCGFDFQQVYGAIGKDYIHVHHLTEISTLGPGYKIDPVKEMRPLCANCHAMVHRERPALTPAALRRRLKPTVHRPLIGQ